jgi:hypothetical protein
MPAVTSTSTPVTPGSLLISARTALAQWSQVIPVTAIWRVDTIVIVAAVGRLRRRVVLKVPCGVVLQQPSPHELVIGGMTCAARVQAKLNRLDGVTASVNLSTERAGYPPRRISQRATWSTWSRRPATPPKWRPRPGPSADTRSPSGGHAIPVVSGTVAAWCRRPAARPGMTLSSAFVVWNSLRLRRFVPRPFNRTDLMRHLILLAPF